MQLEKVDTDDAPRLLSIFQSTNPWIRFAIRRLVGLVAVLVTLFVVTFAMVHAIPGDPARLAAGIEATPAEVEAIRESMGLEQPIATQFLHYVTGAVRLDFGESFRTGETVTSIIADRLPYTVALAATGLALAFVFSFPVGILIAILTKNGQRHGVETAFSGIAGFGAAIPEFLVGMLLALVFGMILRILPVAGANSVAYIILPAISVASHPAMIISRLVRTEALTVLGEDYVRTARSKRLTSYRVYLVHVLPNVLTASLTQGGVIAAGMLGGTVIVENVFSWPGLGTAVVEAVLGRDYPLVQGVVLLLGIGVVLVNLVIDVILALTNPQSLIKGA